MGRRPCFVPEARVLTNVTKVPGAFVMINVTNAPGTFVSTRGI